MTTRLITIALAGALACGVTAANADIRHYAAQLKGANEAQPVAGKGHGVLTATLDTDRGELDYSVEYSDLSGPAVAAGFQESASHDPIPVAPVSGASGTLHGVVKVTPAQIRDFNSTLWFFNISTSANPNGEVRGKVYRDD